ncbi:DsbA family protein [Helicobacter colisuis]|uniref:DsbA family protein n=1 Tax=Helicobacter colisuis TaxID=2949739 RepID=UPI002029E5FC|nr:DsbA family protein [Helicobacter colisuis]MCL9823292.1 DsbA family protein [Helicobacter colisuis]
MKIFKLWLIGICLFSLQALANDLKENVDYIVLKKPIFNMQNKVIEIFNIGCPHCAYYNANFVPNLLEFLPENVEFLPYHVAAAIPIHEETSNILVVALAKDKEKSLELKDNDSLYKKILNHYFNAIHKERKNWSNRQEFLKEGLEILGISEAEYKEVLKAKNSREALKQWQSMLEYTEIQGVPSFVINGKYMILSSGIKGVEDFIYKVDYLLTK